jgi:hypothetical protein
MSFKYLLTSILFASTALAQPATARPTSPQKKVVRIAAARAASTPIFVNPRSYSGLLMWFDADDASTITGSPVSQWADKSGNNNHLVQPTAGQRPATGSVVNTHNCLSFSAASSNWMYATGVSGTPNTVIAIFKSADVTFPNFSAFIGSRASSSDKVANSAHGSGIFATSGTTKVYTVASATGVRIDGFGGASATDFSNYLVSVGFTGGVDSVAHMVVYTDDHSATGVDNYVVGADPFSAVGTRHFNGNICEILVYNRALTQTEIGFIEIYLVVKWIFVGGGGGD